MVAKIALRQSGIEMPAIALSGFGTAEDVRASLDAGFREHLTKPVDLDRLLAAVRRLREERAPA
jgi:two-component system CheB/CheR fusion protein